LLADELLSGNVTVIVTWDAPASLTAKAATKNTPIVFLTGVDPVKIGLVQSLSRPSGNLTGIYNMVVDVGPKHLELLRELLPTANIIVSLSNPGNPNAHAYVLQTQAAADALGLRLQVLTARTEADLEAAFAIMVQQRADALLVIADPFFIARREQIVALAAGHAIPAIYPFIAYPDFVLELTLFFGFLGTAEAKTSGSSRWRDRPSRSVKVHTPRPVLGVIGSLRADVRSPVADEGIQ
jgi:putative tryptophan/tyrosine transport system substrate-binding protein